MDCRQRSARSQGSFSQGLSRSAAKTLVRRLPTGLPLSPPLNRLLRGKAHKNGLFACQLSFSGAQEGPIEGHGTCPEQQHMGPDHGKLKRAWIGLHNGSRAGIRRGRWQRR
jgi:hypothetical protein